MPEHSTRLVLLAGMVGARQRVWFEMTDDLLDPRAGTLTIPEWLSKNGCEHCIYFTDLEVGLFREQLMARAAGSAFVFPTPTGRQSHIGAMRSSGRAGEPGDSGCHRRRLNGVGQERR